MSELRTPEEYRQLADEARQSALRATHPELKRILERFTNDYELLADSIEHLRAMEQRIRDSKP